MPQSMRFLLLLTLAVASGVFAERAVAGRARAREALDRAGRENAEHIQRLDADRLARLEAHADVIRTAAAGAMRRARAVAAAPVPTAPPAPVKAPAPKIVPAVVRTELKPVQADQVRERMRGISGAIVPASSGPSNAHAAAATPAVFVDTVSPPAPVKPEEKKDERKPGTGLRAEYWKFVDTELHEFPDVDRKVATIVRVDARINFPDVLSFKLPFLCRNLAVRWRGFLFIEAEGVYTFTIGSDDGSVVLLDGRTAIDNDGLHPYTERSAETYLTQGYHPIEVRFFQNEVHGAAILSWVPLHGEPGPVPMELLYPADRVRADQAPTITKVTPEHARSGQVVTIEGSGFPTPPEAVEATFGGQDMDARVVDEHTIRATVPKGVDRAQVVVRFRDVSSLGFAYESGDVFGLLGEYIASPRGQPIAGLFQMPPEGAPGEFRRVDPSIAFDSLEAFGLPFAGPRFAARYRGSICILDEGQYRFKLTSDNGARLSVEGAPTIELDGLRAMASAEANVALARGLHDVLIEFFNNDGDAGLVLEWIRPGHDRFERVPRRAFYPPPLTARNDPPSIIELLPAAVAVGDRLEIHGQNFMGDGGGDRVLLNASPLPIEAASPTRIVTRMPSNACSGPLVVQSGELSSRPAQVTVVGRGLRGEYFRFDHDLQQLPVLTGKPDFERIDPEISFGEGYSFSLPFEAERFATQWTGAIEAPWDGEYRFDLASDDGSRLTIDGELVIDNDGMHPPLDRFGTASLSAGRHAITVDFFQNQGLASIHFLWQLPGSTALARVPETALFPDRP